MSVTTSTSLFPGPFPPAVPTEPIWRLTLDQYHQMIRTGILTDDDPVELLEGWLVTKMPKTPQHRAATRLVQSGIDSILPAGWYTDSQEPITIDDSEPEPDVVVVRGDTRNYLDRHPGPPDLAMVVEIADSSLARDRGPKKRLSARGAVAVYWIVNLNERCIEVYSDPSGPAETPQYRQSQVYIQDTVVPVILDGREISRVAVRQMLP